MPVDYEDYSDEEDEVPKQKPRQTALDVEDEEAFPDFGGGAAPAPSSGLNFSAAWSSTKAPAEMPQVVAVKKKRPAAAPADMSTPATAGFGSAPAAMEKAPREYTGAGVPWSDHEWNKSAGKQASWSAKTTSTMWEQARQSNGNVRDPYANVSTSYSTVPQPKAAKPSSPEQTKSKAKDSEAAPAEAPKKQKQADAPKKKDSEGFTEVAKKAEPQEKKKKDKKKEKKVEGVGENSAFAALLGDGEEKENETPGAGKKNRKQQKQEKQEEKQKEDEVKVDTRPKKNKKEKKKKEEDEFDLPTEKKGKAKSGKGKKGADSDPGTNMMMGLAGAAVVAVAGVAYFMSSSSQ